MAVSVKRLQHLDTVTLPNGDRFSFLWLTHATLNQLVKLKQRGIGCP